MDAETFTWLVAIEKAVDGDSAGLAEQFASGAVVTAEARQLLARFFSGDPTLAPRLTERDFAIHYASEEWRARRSGLPRGEDREKAETRLLAELARKYGVAPSKKEPKLSKEGEAEVARERLLDPVAAAKRELDDRDGRDATALRAALVRQKGNSWRRARFVRSILGDD